MLSFIPSLQTSQTAHPTAALHSYVEDGGACSGLLVSLCHSFLLTSFLCSGVGSPWAAVPSGIFSCSTGGSSTGCRGYLLCHGAVPPPLFSDFGVPFLTLVFPQVPPACLRSSAVLCGGSVGSRCVLHRTAPGLFPQWPPIQVAPTSRQCTT